LQHAFERGMVHRDIKPANILLAVGSRQQAVGGKETSSPPTACCPLPTVAKITDFGLARLTERTQALTPWGAVVGTPDYTAPEQARDPQEADIRADIYSLGCTLYHLLAGQPPFPEGSTLQKLLAHQDQPPKQLLELRASVPAELGQVVARMMAKEPAQRYRTPAEVAEALSPFLTGKAADGKTTPAQTGPPHWQWVASIVGLVLAASLMVAVVAYIASDRQRRTDDTTTAEGDKGAGARSPSVGAPSPTVGARSPDRAPTREEHEPPLVGGIEPLPTAKDWIPLGNKNPLPAHLQGGDHVLADKDGLRTNGRTYVLSKDSDFLKKDFKFEIVFSQKPDKEGTAFIGIGTGSNRSAYNEPVESVYLGIPPPNVNNGSVGLSKGPHQTVGVGVIRRAGTHRVVIEKKGNVVTFTVDVGNDGPSDDDIERTIPDIKAHVPFLDGSNTHIFFGGGGTYQKMRLTERFSKEEKPTRGADKARARPDGGLALGGKNPFPPFMQANDSILANKEGVRVRHGRMQGNNFVLSKSGEYLAKDFTLELTVGFERENEGISFVGIGAVDPGGAYGEPLNTVYLRMHPPNFGDGWVGLTKQPMSNGTNLGRFRKFGPHRVIIEKKGNSVTFSVDVGNDGKSDDDFEKTIPDIRAFAPFLNNRNTFLFFGGGGTYQRMRLVEKIP
jgi:hypothetical protein